MSNGGSSNSSPRPTYPTATDCDTVLTQTQTWNTCDPSRLHRATSMWFPRLRHLLPPPRLLPLAGGDATAETCTLPTKRPPPVMPPLPATLPCPSCQKQGAARAPTTVRAAAHQSTGGLVRQKSKGLLPLGLSQSQALVAAAVGLLNLLLLSIRPRLSCLSRPDGKNYFLLSRRIVVRQALAAAPVHQTHIA